MYQKILVPLDGSARAEKILPHVVAVARMNDAAVVFLQVVRPMVVSDGYKGILVEKSQEESEKAVAEALKYLAKIEGRFREQKITTRKYSKIGSVVETVIEIANQEAVDLIAMASHGRTGLSRVFYGSVAAGVLQCIDRPLLLIRSRDPA